MILSNHIKNCLTINGKQAINMPKEGEKILKFNNFHKQLPVPFVIHADFEAVTKKVQEQMKKPIEMRRRDRTLKPTKLMNIVAVDIRSYVATMINTVSLFKGTEVKTLFISSWKICVVRLNTAKTLLRNLTFMSSSLNKLVSNLPKEVFKYTSQVFKGKKLDLMSKKGVYPYDFMDSFEKFDQMELPTKE